MVLKPVSSTRRPLYAAMIVLVALFAGLLADCLHQISKQNIGAFGTYYEAATAMREGRDPYAARSNTYPYIYPPLYAFLCQPLAGLARATAARVMLAVDAILILAALLLGAWAMLGRLGVTVNAASVLVVAMFTAVIAVVPIHNELRGLETNAVMLLSFVLALYWLDERPVWAGLALAVAISVKYLPVVALPYLILRRRWTAVVSTILWLPALALLPASSLGWSTNLHYLQVAQGGLLHLAGVHIASQTARVNDITHASSLSVTSTLMRLAAASGWPKAIGLGMALVAAVGFVVVVLAGYRRHRMPWLRWPTARGQSGRPFRGLLALEWAGVVTAALAFSPNTQNRNLVLAVVPAMMAVVMLCFPRRGVSQWPLWVGTLLMLIALVLPIASMGRRNTALWLSDGMPCWWLLAAYATLMWAGLTYVRAAPEDSVETPHLPHHEDDNSPRPLPMS